MPRIPEFLRLDLSGALRDQHRLLRVVAAEAAQAMADHPEGQRIAELLDGCVDEIGRLVERLRA